MENKMLGRQWVSTLQNINEYHYSTKTPAIKNGYCQRCNSQVSARLPDGTQYCRDCIGLGRICADDYLLRLTGPANFPKIKQPLLWQGKLTASQQVISKQLIQNYIQKKNTLVHAVTGAGKTEMLFDLISECLKEGGRICIATPRIDVVNELYPRFQAAFAVKIGKYHGREFHEPACEQLTICTTHQLLKFYRCFDLLVIDEVDSFPYVDNRQLHFAAKNAVNCDGVRIYLTATPTEDLLAEVKAGQLQILTLNRRFHGHLLPVPKEKLFFRKFVNHQKLNSKLVLEIKKVLKAGHQLLVFVPRIEQIPIYLQNLTKDSNFDKVKMAGVCAEDPQRLEKVEQFRSKKLQLLITTTILERGVTFKGVWVIVVACEDPIYHAENLVQIAGRVGRDKNDPDGLVLFCYQKYTKTIRKAVKQIKEMNR